MQQGGGTTEEKASTPPTKEFTVGSSAGAAVTIISVNGARQALEPGAAFPAADPSSCLLLSAPDAKTAVIGIAGGAYASGAKTTKLKVGKPLTLVNTTTGARYRIALVAVGNGDDAAPVTTGPDAMMARLRGQQGFALIEMLVAIVVINIGLLAILLALNSGMVTLRRSAETSTASAVADKQLELYRAHPIHVDLPRHVVARRDRLDVSVRQRVLRVAGESGLQPARRSVHSVAVGHRARRPYVSRRHLHRLDDSGGVLTP